MIRRLAILMGVAMTSSGCQMLVDLLSTDTVIEASCLGDDTVVLDGRDLCKEFEQHGKVSCDVGYRIRLNGQTVCPPPFGQEPLAR